MKRAIPSLVHDLEMEEEKYGDDGPLGLSQKLECI